MSKLGKIQDVVENALVAGLSFVADHGWNLADRTFRLSAWLLAIGALNALNRHTPSTELQILVWVLIVLWAVAAFSSFLNAMTFLMAAAVTSAKKRGLSWVAAVLAFGPAAFVILLAKILLPFSTAVFTVVFEAVSSK